MSRITRMNGQRLRWFSYADFGQPGRRSQISSHISRETAERAVIKMRRNPIYGHIWIEDAAARRFEVA